MKYRLIAALFVFASAVNAQTIFTVTNNILSPSHAALSGPVGSFRLNAELNDGVDPVDLTGSTNRLYVYDAGDYAFWPYTNASLVGSFGGEASGGKVRWVLPSLAARTYLLYGYSIPADTSLTFQIAFHTLSVTNAPSTTYLQSNLQFGYNGATNTPSFLRLYGGGAIATGTVDGANLSLYLEGGAGSDLSSLSNAVALKIDGAEATNNFLLLAGGTVSGDDFLYTGTNTTDHAVATKGFVRSLLDVGREFFWSTNVASFAVAPTNADFNLSTEEPADIFTNVISVVSNDQYLIAHLSTQTFAAIRSPVSFNLYLSRVGNTAFSVVPEIYYTYDDGVNLLGDYTSLGQAITTGTNRYNWIVSFPEPAITAAVRVITRLQVTALSGGPLPTLNVLGGGALASHVDFTIPATATAESDPIYSASEWATNTAAAIIAAGGGGGGGMELMGSSIVTAGVQSMTFVFDPVHYLYVTYEGWVLDTAAAGNNSLHFQVNGATPWHRLALYQTFTGKAVPEWSAVGTAGDNAQFTYGFMGQPAQTNNPANPENVIGTLGELEVWTSRNTIYSASRFIGRSTAGNTYLAHKAANTHTNNLSVNYITNLVVWTAKDSTPTNFISASGVVTGRVDVWGMKVQ